MVERSLNAGGGFLGQIGLQAFVQNLLVMRNETGSGAKPSPPRDSRGVSGAVRPEACTVLHIDDDPNDTELLRAATRQAHAPFDLQNVEDGEKAMAYLNGAGIYSDRRRYPLPALVLLDLKMPRATGFELLRWIRQHPKLNRLPVVVLSGSELHADIRRAYDHGANSYLIKPLGFEALVDLVKDVNAVWVGTQTRAS